MMGPGLLTNKPVGANQSAHALTNAQTNASISCLRAHLLHKILSALSCQQFATSCTFET